MKRYGIAISIALTIASVFTACGSAPTAPPEPASPAPPASPIPPTLKAGNDSLEVSWESVKEVDSYNVYYSTEKELPKDQLPAKSSLKETSTSITGLVSGTTYYVWIEAVNAGGKALSERASAATLSPPAPVAPPSPPVPAKPPSMQTPANLKVSGGVASIDVSWGMVELAKSYNVYCGTDETRPSSPAYGKSGLTEINTTINGLENGKQYYIWIEAVGAGENKVSASASATTLILQAPAAPTLNAGVGNISINWKKVDLADSYNVYYSTEDKKPETPTKRGVTDNSTTATGLTKGSIYYVWIEAVNAGGTTPSEKMQVRTSLSAHNTTEFKQAIDTIYENPDVGEYIIVLTGSFASDGFDLGSEIAKTIIIRGDGSNRILSNTGNNALFILRSGITLVLDANATINGNSKNHPVVSILKGGRLNMENGSQVIGANISGIFVNGGIFNMNGGTIKDNNASDTSSVRGGGVHVAANGVFTMTGGEISGNTVNAAALNAASYGGGVYVAANGVFTMLDGVISGNTVSVAAVNSFAYGGGVYAEGDFNMTGGVINGNNVVAALNTSAYGGGVYSRGVFVKQGGIIESSNSAKNGRVAYAYSGNKKRDTVAGADIDLNSDVNGKVGGWE